MDRCTDSKRRHTELHRPLELKLELRQNNLYRQEGKKKMPETSLVLGKYKANDLPNIKLPWPAI